MFADRRVLFAGEVDIQGGPPLSRRMLREKLLLTLSQLDAMECDDSPDEAATPSAQVR